MVGAAGYGLPASDWSYGYIRSFFRRDSAFDRSICFILRSGTHLQSVLGSASSCVHPATDHLFPANFIFAFGHFPFGINKEVVGIQILLDRLLFGCDIVRKMLPRDSLVKATSADSQFR